MLFQSPMLSDSCFATDSLNQDGRRGITRKIRTPRAPPTKPVHMTTSLQPKSSTSQFMGSWPVTSPIMPTEVVIPAISASLLGGNQTVAT